MLTGTERALLQRTHSQMVHEIRERLVEFATYQWGSLGSWRDDDIDRFVSIILPRVQAGQRSVASLTNAYLAQVTGVTAARNAALADDVFARLRGEAVTPAEVYRRPAVTMRTALADGQPFSAALAQGAVRLASLVSTDLQLAKTHQSRATMRAAGSAVGGYRRVPTGRENCALCLIASTQRYHRGGLMPIHPGCDCDQEPLAPGEAVNQVIDPSLLEQTHDWASAAAGIDLVDRGARDLGLGTGRDYTELLVTREHGELGPVLTWRHQSFTGPGDVAA